MHWVKGGLPQAVPLLAAQVEQLASIMARLRGHTARERSRLRSSWQFLHLLPKLDAPDAEAMQTTGLSRHAFCVMMLVRTYRYDHAS